MGAPCAVALCVCVQSLLQRLRWPSCCVTYMHTELSEPTQVLDAASTAQSIPRAAHSSALAASWGSMPTRKVKYLRGHGVRGLSVQRTLPLVLRARKRRAPARRTIFTRAHLWF